MSYTTISSVTASAWQVSGEVDAEIVHQGIVLADAIIDAHLSPVYSVPFAAGSVPALVEHLSTVMARYWGQHFVGKSLVNLQEPDKEAYKHAMDLLRSLGEKRIVLPGVTISSVDDTCYSNTQEYHTIFDVDDELFWSPDSDRLDSISDERATD